MIDKFAFDRNNEKVSVVKMHQPRMLVWNWDEDEQGWAIALKWWSSVDVGWENVLGLIYEN